MMRYLLFAALAAMVACGGGGGGGDDDGFSATLHATRAGFETWYGASQGGFETLTGIPLEQTGCTDCHRPDQAGWTGPGCGDCHLTDPEDGVASDTCLGCHYRQAAEIAMLTATQDVHRAAGFECTTCHREEEFHGTGGHASMLDEGGISVTCIGCHVSPPANEAHNVHMQTVECAACHMQGALSCLNCHFDSQVAGNGRVSHATTLDSIFLLNRNGKVHPGTLVTMKYEDKTFAVIAPYVGHNISREARACADCHHSEAMRQYDGDGLVQVVTWNPGAGRLDHLAGVIPVPPDYEAKFRIDFADWDGVSRDAGNEPVWTFLGTGADMIHMLHEYGSPLTAAQLERLR